MSHSLTYSLTDNLKSRDASASKNTQCYVHCASCLYTAFKTIITEIKITIQRTNNTRCVPAVHLQLSTRDSRHIFVNLMMIIIFMIIVTSKAVAQIQLCMAFCGHNNPDNRNNSYERHSVES